MDREGWDGEGEGGWGRGAAESSASGGRWGVRGGGRETQRLFCFLLLGVLVVH